MRLRGRFTLWFSLAALIPIAVAALVTRQVVSESFRADFERTRAAAERAAGAEVGGLAEEVARTVRVLAEENRDIEGLLFELQTEGVVRPDVLRALQQRDDALMRAAGLDLMFIIDDAGTILSSPHGAAEGERDRLWRERARRSRGETFFSREAIEAGGELRSEVVAVAARTRREGARTITVVGGRILRSALLDRIRQVGRVEARVVAPGGELLLASGTYDGVEADPIRRPLPGIDGAPVAFVEIAISDAELRRLLRQVTVAAALMAAAAVLVTVLLGFVVARGMTRDLDDLVAGVEAVARGDLEHRVPARKRDEIGAVANAVNEMMRDLKQANERLAVAERIAAWQEIARRLAHEIKNPLTPIQMSVETLRKTRAKGHPSFDEIFEESTATVLEEVGRLKRIVAEFSEFARMPKPQRRPSDLNEVVRGAVALYKGGGQIVERLAADLPAISADRDQLAQVVLNLIENARDALAGRPGGAGDGRVTVTTRPAEGGEAVQLIVDDDGPGLSEAVRDKLFTPYFTTKHASGGTGLGLAIVHRIVADHHGRVTAGDAPGGGARFVVELPIALPADEPS